jgi:uncharacterized protein YhaN
VRFDGLHLVAYGPFTDRRLDLSAGAFGVHVVFGPNEAGKSSALRALRALLFGFPHQTDDAFLHPYARLEVGAQLRRPDGSVLTCYRRKRLRDSLLDANREPLPDDILEPLLGGVDAALFGALYGIDDLALERGGRALLEERGRESEALFGAGLGRVAAHRVLTELDAEAEALFAPRASTRTLNKLLKQADELRQRERDATLLTSRFEALREEARQARRALESAEAAHAEAVRELAHLRRVRAALGPLDRLAGARRRLHAIGDVPALPEDFGRRLEAAQEQRRRAHTRQGDACAREKALVAELHTCVVNEALLSRADEVEMLRDRAAAQRAGAGEDARRALEAEGLHEEEAALRQRLPEALRDATGEDLDAWLGCRRRAEELIETGSRVLGANEDARARRDDAGAERERRRAALEALSEAAQLAGLRDSVAAVHRAGDVDARLAEARREREAAARRVEEDCAALGRWPHDPDALLCAQLPDAETVRAFVERARGLALEARRLDEAEAAALARRDEAREQLRALELRGPVPGEDDLVAARAHRDEGWRLLQARWVESAPDVEAERSFAGPRGIASAFESAVRAADEVADRLRREATMVAAASQTRAAAERAAGDLEALAGRRDALARESRAQEAHWRSLWSALAIEAGTPAEMEAWLHGATVLRERLRRLTERRDREAALAAERDALGARLAQELADAGVDGAGRAEALHALRVRAEAVIAEADRAAAERERARAALDDAAIAASRAESEAARAARAHAEWREAWGALARSLALDPAVPPGALRDHFELLLALHRVRAALAEAAARREATRRGVDGARRPGAGWRASRRTWRRCVARWRPTSQAPRRWKRRRRWRRCCQRRARRRRTASVCAETSPPRGSSARMPGAPWRTRGTSWRRCGSWRAVWPWSSWRTWSRACASIARRRRRWRRQRRS